MYITSPVCLIASYSSSALVIAEELKSFAQRAEKYSAGVNENSVQCCFNEKLKADTVVKSEFSWKTKFFSYKNSSKDFLKIYIH